MMKIVMDFIEEFLLVFQFIFFMVVGNLVCDDGGEQVLEFGLMFGCMVKDVQGFWLFFEQVWQVCVDYCVGFEFVECWIDFQFWCGQFGGFQVFEGGVGGVLLVV